MTPDATPDDILPALQIPEETRAGIQIIRGTRTSFR